MSVSALFGSRLAVPPPSSAPSPGGQRQRRLVVGVCNGGGGLLVIECSSRPQNKATAHHKKTRPRKTNPSDIRRGPTVYPPLPPLPSEWTLVTVAAADAVVPLEPVESLSNS